MCQKYIVLKFNLELLSIVCYFILPLRHFYLTTLAADFSVLTGCLLVICDQSGSVVGGMLSETCSRKSLQETVTCSTPKTCFISEW